MPDVSELLELARARAGGQTCWRKRVDGRAKAFIEAVEEAGLEGFTYTGIATVLRTRCDFPIARNTVREHYTEHGDKPCHR